MMLLGSTRRVLDLDWRFLLLILLPLSLLVYAFNSSISSTILGGTTFVSAPLDSQANLTSAPTATAPPVPEKLVAVDPLPLSEHEPGEVGLPTPTTAEELVAPPLSEPDEAAEEGKEEVEPPEKAEEKSTMEKQEVVVGDDGEGEPERDLNRAKIAVCLVGGARRFELTGPSIMEKILKVYPKSDLFLHCPLDANSYKLSLLRAAPRIAAVKIFKPTHINETEAQARVLTPENSPNGIQGLLQYFNLVEGCLTMIRSYQSDNNFTYDWIIRTRVDGYWSNTIRPEYFIPGNYIVLPGSSYGGLNDRFGLGDFNTSVVALSRLSLIPELDNAGYEQLNSERAFMAQLITQNVIFTKIRLPFCVVTDRQYPYPPGPLGVPVVALSSPGPLSGAKCRPCTAACTGECIPPIMSKMNKYWSWTDWGNNSIELCDAHGDWEEGWEDLFDNVAGKKLAAARKRLKKLRVKQCVSDFKAMKSKSTFWEAPNEATICRLGLLKRH